MVVIFTYLDRREPWRGREAAPKPRRWRGSPVRCGRNGKKAKNRKKSGDAGLGEDYRGARRPRRRRTSLERCRTWPESEPRAGAWVTVRRGRSARGGAWDSGCRWGFHWSVDQPSAVRNMWSVPGKEVAGKIRRKGLPAW